MQCLIGFLCFLGQVADLSAELAAEAPEATLAAADAAVLQSLLQAAQTRSVPADAELALLQRLLAWYIPLQAMVGSFASCFLSPAQLFEKKHRLWIVCNILH